MHSFKEVAMNFTEISVSQYAKQSGLSNSTVRRRCEQGLLDAYKLNVDSDGGHWRIRIPKDNLVNRSDYEQAINENTRLRLIINGMVKLAEAVT